MDFNKESYEEIIKGYLDRTAKIRRLSVPSVSDASNEVRYRELFGENARRIEPLFMENKRVVDEIFMPMLSPKHTLTTEEIEFLNLFAGQLQNNSGVEYLDTSLLWRISERLFEDAKNKDDLDYLIAQIDLMIIASTGKAIQAKSLHDSRDIWSYYQEKGAQAVEMMFPYLEKDKFTAIASEETRELLVINSRYFCVVFEAPDQDPKINEMIIDRLIASYEMSFDPDYTNLLPEYDWIRHRVKCLEYLGQLTERSNEQGITDAQAARILEYVYKLKEFYEEEEEVASKYISASDIDLFLAKNNYYSGKITNDEYKKKLIYYYKNRFEDRLGARFKEYDTFINFQLPNEYIGALDRDNLSEEDIANVEYIYQGVIMDAYTMPNRDEFTAAMEYFSRLLDNYIEIPGGISFKDFCINFLAATKPQTFIHTISIAEIARCLSGYLVEKRPELFLGMFGAGNIEAVKAKRRDIMAYAYNAGLVQDIGKVGLLPVLSIVERPAFPEEEELLSRYASSGRKLAKRSVSTSPYINAIAGHYERYDSRQLQEDGYNSWNVTQKAIVDILYLSKDIDDIAERLEIQGKSVRVKNLMPMIKRGVGTIYAPYLFNILSVPEVETDIDFLLSGGRDDIYRRTYVVLKSVVDRGKI